MLKMVIEQSDTDILTAHSGLALVGACINRYTSLGATLGKTGGRKGRISDFDVLASYTGLLCLGKSDFEAIAGRQHDDFFAHALDIDNRPLERDPTPKDGRLRHRNEQEDRQSQRRVNTSG